MLTSFRSKRIDTGCRKFMRELKDVSKSVFSECV